MSKENTKTRVAKALLEIGAVGFTPDKPITFKTGILSPVYVDNRILPSNPAQWKIVLEALAEEIKSIQHEPAYIAGIETAGIPHSSVVGYLLGWPSVFVRKQVKDHGAKKMIEGGNVAGKKAILIEDHITTASSSLHGVEELRAAGAMLTDCFCITTYGFAESEAAMLAAGITLHALTTFDEILVQAKQMNKITAKEEAVVREWLADPHNWKPQT
jgi:orotate phosphoribosyltransferase